jgi:predicted Rossmann fold nucleotide-binding protein DprA/Smf involved in DNA uptake
VSVIGETREKLQARLQELQPCLDEAARIDRLLKAMDALDSEPGSGGGDAQRLPAETRKLQILGVLRDTPIMRIKELAEALKVTPGRAVQLVNELEAEGTANRVEGGVAITGAGRSLVPPKMKIKVGSWERVAKP